MSKLTVAFKCDNDAFAPEDGDKGTRDREIARVLEDLARRFRYGASGESDHGYRVEWTGLIMIPLYDINGNHIGHAAYTPSKD